MTNAVLVGDSAVPKLYLPNPYPDPQTERESLIGGLYKIGVLIPGSETMEIQQLRDYFDWQMERVDSRPLRKGNVPPEAVGAIREYMDWRRKKGYS